MRFNDSTFWLGAVLPAIHQNRRPQADSSHTAGSGLDECPATRSPFEYSVGRLGDGFAIFSPG